MGRGRGGCAVHGNAVGVRTQQLGIQGGVVFDVVDVVVLQLDMVRGALDVYPNGQTVWCDSLIVADLKALDNDVALIYDQKHTAIAVGD